MTDKHPTPWEIWDITDDFSNVVDAHGIPVFIFCKKETENVKHAVACVNSHATQAAEIERLREALTKIRDGISPPENEAEAVIRFIATKALED